jgi:homoserine kinase type II
MGVFTEVSCEAVDVLLRSYALGSARTVTGIPAGSVNSNYALETTLGGRVFLRVYEEQDEAGARAEAALLRTLAARAVKTPPPVLRTDGEALSSIAGKPAALFPWIEGGMRCQASVTTEDARRVGAELARVHVAGVGLAVGAGRFTYDDLLLRVERIAQARADLAAEAAPLERRLRDWMARRQDLPQGLVHGDLFRDNVLWSPDGEIVALLDFESASHGVYAYDLMVTVLSWCFGDGLDTGLARAIVAGYCEVRTLEERERRGLLAEGCLAALRFTITRITDYAMKEGIGPRVLKDWRRFARRYEALEALGERGLREALGL